MPFTAHQSSTLSTCHLVDDKRLATGIHLAAKEGDLTLVEDLLCGGSSEEEGDSEPGKNLTDDHEQDDPKLHPFHPDAREHGLTPLHYAVQNQRMEVVELLFRHGADPDLRNTSGWSALHMASSIASAEMVRLLLDWGADPHVVDNRGMPPKQHHVQNDPEVDRLLTAAQGALSASVGADTDIFQLFPTTSAP